jgi:cytochrome c6
MMKSSVLATISALTLCLFGIAAIAKVAHNYDSIESPASAAELFNKHCASCHGKDGQSKTFKAKFNHARNLADPEWHANVSDERIFNSITRGKGKMPAFGKKLTESEIDSLVAYIRGLKK